MDPGYLLPFNELGRLVFTLTFLAEGAPSMHTWSWEVESGQVRGTLDGRRVRFQLGAARGEAAEAAEEAFLTDTFWLDPAIHLTWAVAGGMEPTTRRGDDGTQVVVLHYPSGGYAPGHVHELTLDARGQVEGWSWRPTGGTPSLEVRFEDRTRVGPLRVARRRTAKGEGPREVRAGSLQWYPRVGALAASDDRAPIAVVRPDGCRVGGVDVGWSPGKAALRVLPTTTTAGRPLIRASTPDAHLTIHGDPTTLQVSDASWLASTGFLGCDWAAVDTKALDAALTTMDPADREVAVLALWSWATAAGVLPSRGRDAVLPDAVRCASAGDCTRLLQLLRRATAGPLP